MHLEYNLRPLEKERGGCFADIDHVSSLQTVIRVPLEWPLCKWSHYTPHEENMAAIIEQKCLSLSYTIIGLYNEKILLIKLSITSVNFLRYVGLWYKQYCNPQVWQTNLCHAGYVYVFVLCWVSSCVVWGLVCTCTCIWMKWLKQQGGLTKPHCAYQFVNMIWESCIYCTVHLYVWFIYLECYSSKWYILVVH